MNSFRLFGRIEDKAGWIETHSPCLHHAMNCHVRIVGDPAYPSYHCRVKLRRELKEEAVRHVRADHGMHVRIRDHQNQDLLVKDLDIATVNAAGFNRTTPIDFEYTQEIPHDQRVQVAAVSILMGLQIYPNFWASPNTVVQKAGIEFSYEVIPTGGYILQPDGSKIYKPFPPTYEAVVSIDPRLDTHEGDPKAERVPVAIAPRTEVMHPLKP
jgi:hypothetical protein